MIQKLCKDIVILNLNRGYSYGNGNNHMNSSIYTEAYSVVREQDLKDCYSKLKDKTYSPTAKDKLYFYPNCIVPRFKIREMWKPKKVAVTIKEDNGTHKFLCSEISKYSEVLNSVFKVPSDIIITWFKSMDNLFVTYNLENMRYENLPSDILNSLNNDEYVYVNYQFDCILDDRGTSILYGSSSGFTPITYNNLPSVDPYNSLPGTNFLVIKEEKVISAFEDIYAGNDADYYIDATVNRALQDESTVIDENMYDQLKNLFKSDDDSNHTMAMEVMANANVAKSAKFIYRLFRTFQDKIIYNSAYDSVNFKALVETTGLKKYVTFSDDSYINFMNKYNQLGIDTVLDIRKKACDIALAAAKREFQSIIDDGILEIEFPFAKVVLKGVNDGSSNIVFVDEAEKTTVKEANSNPAQYSDDYDLPTVAPCAADDLEEEVSVSITEDETTDLEATVKEQELVNGDLNAELPCAADTGDAHGETQSNEEDDNVSDNVSEEDTKPVILSEEEENAELIEKYGHLYVPSKKDEKCETTEEIFPGTMDELKEITVSSQMEPSQEEKDQMMEAYNEDVEAGEYPNATPVKDLDAEEDKDWDKLEEIGMISQDNISENAADEEMQEMKTEQVIEEKEKEGLNIESQAIESVVKPVVEAIKPESDDWWETSETTTSDDSDPFA